MKKKLENKGGSTTLQSQLKKLEFKLKRETFSKLGLGISEIERRTSWGRRREGLPKLLLEF